MKIVVLHGQNHKGSTYHITHLLLDKMTDKDTQFQEYNFSNQSYCVGCFLCLQKGEEKCPHYEQIHPIISDIEEADLIIMESPCYCMGMTGQIKSFLDHLAYRWFPHRPDSRMFTKVGVAISTAAGAGAKKTTKDFRNHMFFWGIPAIYRLYEHVGASSWLEVSNKKKAKIEIKVDKLAKKLQRKVGKVKPTIRVKGMFEVMRMNQQGNTWNELDRSHWEKQGWLAKEKPWGDKVY